MREIDPRTAATTHTDLIPEAIQDVTEEVQEAASAFEPEDLAALAPAEEAAAPEASAEEAPALAKAPEPTIEESIEVEEAPQAALQEPIKLEPAPEAAIEEPRVAEMPQAAIEQPSATELPAQEVLEIEPVVVFGVGPAVPDTSGTAGPTEDPSAEVAPAPEPVEPPPAVPPPPAFSTQPIAQARQPVAPKPRWITTVQEP